MLNLQKHFGQANEDVAQILTSAEKVAQAAAGGSKRWSSATTTRQAAMAIPAPVGRKATAAE